MTNTFEGIVNKIEPKTFQLTQRYLIFSQEFSGQLEGAAAFNSKFAELNRPNLEELYKASRELLDVTLENRQPLAVIFTQKLSAIYVASLMLLDAHFEKELQLKEGRPSFIIAFYEQLFLLVKELFDTSSVLFETIAAPQENTINAS